MGVVAIFAGLAIAAGIDGTWIGAILLGAAAVLIAGSMAHDCAAAMGLIVPAVAHNSDEPAAAPEAEPSSNGTVPAAAAPLLRDVSANGNSANGHVPERGRDAVQGNGSIGPPPLLAHEAEVDMTERED
jgi:hypothetical protein